MSLLLDKIGIECIIDSYYKKIDNAYAPIIIHRALLDYDEIEQQEDPVSIINETWEYIKGNIRRHINNHLKTEF